MASINGIKFSYNEDSALELGKISSAQTDADLNRFRKVINALEIDWNGAVLPNANPANGGATSAINDTSELLALINTMQKEIYVLTAAVIALAQR